MREDLKVCNCATCGQLLVASTTWGGLPTAERAMLLWVAGRILGRPYCSTCLRVKQPVVRPVRVGDDNPANDNAVRVLEGE